MNLMVLVRSEYRKGRKDYNQGDEKKRKGYVGFLPLGCFDLMADKSCTLWREQSALYPRRGQRVHNASAPGVTSCRVILRLPHLECQVQWMKRETPRWTGAVETWTMTPCAVQPAEGIGGHGLAVYSGRRCAGHRQMQQGDMEGHAVCVSIHAQGGPGTISVV